MPAIHRLSVSPGQLRGHGLDGFAFAVEQQAAHSSRTPVASLAPPRAAPARRPKLFQTLSTFLDFALGPGLEINPFPARVINLT